MSADGEGAKPLECPDVHREALAAFARRGATTVGHRHDSPSPERAAELVGGWRRRDSAAAFAFDRNEQESREDSGRQLPRSGVFPLAKAATEVAALQRLRTIDVSSEFPVAQAKPLL